MIETMSKVVEDEVFLEIMKEESCIEDCIEMIKVYVNRGNYDFAKERCKDVQKSLDKLSQLQKSILEIKRYMS